MEGQHRVFKEPREVEQVPVRCRTETLGAAMCAPVRGQDAWPRNTR